MNFSVAKNLNPTSIGFLSLVWEDFVTHKSDPLSQGFWALLSHRFINLVNSASFPLVRYPVRIFCLIFMRSIEWFTGITILPNTKMGRRVRIWHHSGIIINADEVCDGVIIRQNTTLGEKKGGGRPRIGANVDIGCGAVIIGPIFVGDNSVIGANSVVIRDVPPNSVVAGVPAKIIN